MSRPRMFLKSLTANLSPMEWALIDFYATRYRRDRTEVVRRFIMASVEGDPEFDPAAFRDYVLKTVAPTEQDPDIKERMVQQTTDYANARLKQRA